MNDYQYWQSVPQPKCSVTCYNQRIVRGAKREDATHPVEKLKVSHDGRQCRRCNEFKPWGQYTTQIWKEHDKKNICTQCERDAYHQKKEREKINPGHKKREKEGITTSNMPTVEDERTRALDAIYENAPTVKNNRVILGIQSPEKEFTSKIQYLQSCGYRHSELSEAYGVTIMPDYWQGRD